MIFNIEKGHHYSDGFIYKLFNIFHDSDRLAYLVKFDSSTLYLDDSVDRFDVNKLFGFSIGLHHNNSYRFGWNCLNNKIHIYAYSYINKVRVINEICVIDTDKEYRFIIRINKGKVLFSVIGEDYSIKQVSQAYLTNNFFGYTLWPYFGGNKKAPHKMLIKLVQI